MEELVSFDCCGDILFDLNRKLIIDNKSERKQIGNLDFFSFPKIKSRACCPYYSKTGSRVFFWSIRLILCSWWLVRSWFSGAWRKAQPAPYAAFRCSSNDRKIDTVVQTVRTICIASWPTKKLASKCAHTKVDIMQRRNQSPFKTLEEVKKGLFSHSQTDIIPAVFPRPIDVGCLRDPVPGTPKSNKRPWLIGRPTSSVFSGTRMKLFFCACNLKCLAFLQCKTAVQCALKSHQSSPLKNDCNFLLPLILTIVKNCQIE